MSMPIMCTYRLSGTHNDLRISRMLTCVRLFGFDHLQLPLLKFFLNEIIVEKTLERCRDSCFRFWTRTLQGDARDDVIAYARQLEHWLNSATSHGEGSEPWHFERNCRVCVGKLKTRDWKTRDGRPKK